MHLILPAKPSICAYTTHLIWMIDNVPAKLALFQASIGQSATALATSDGNIRPTSSDSYWPAVEAGQSRPFAKFCPVRDWSGRLSVKQLCICAIIFQVRSAVYFV